MLSAQLARFYGARDISAKMIRPGQGGASVMEATLDGQRFALRISGPFLSARPSWVEFEGALLAQASREGVLVAEATPGVDGIYGQAFEVGLGLLTKWADGDVEWPTPPAKAEILGRTIAHLHRACEGMTAPSDVRPFDTAALLDRPMALLNEVTDAEPLRPFVEEMRARIEAIVPTPQTFGPIHGDVHQGNCHFDGDHATLFDFAQCGIGWRAFDLAGFLWPWRGTHIEQAALRAACDAYLNGYRQERPLVAAEEQALPAFIRARDLWEAGEWIATGDGRQKPEEVAKGIQTWADQWSLLNERLP